ncbi:nitroreductase [Paenibacillus marchantiophytorum]|uniref:Putative NAD(P)H nitroreductase n=1 Tax=Paenibacillus marchantiophytorum TaxID=1619310 RepID=A0ABQ2BRM8_9BACL|nr:nitroreductase [Paenibacillus marchantiophytorum]GGI44515.1 nitroreductase [Paenibacillus marchantiophytorum]
MTQVNEGIAATIRERRTINQFTGEVIPKEVMLALLDDAVWAPFHSRNEPWRFIMYLGAGRKQFSDAVLLTYPKDKLEKLGPQVEDAYCKQVPVTLLVLIEEEPRPKEWEEAFSAASALIQNLQLLAWERGIGVVWKTNEYNWSPEFREAAGVKPGEKVVGTLHLGYFDPVKVRKAKQRKSAAELTTLFE